MDQRPFLILGPDLIAFLAGRACAKQSLKLHECFCFRCRKPREPAFNVMEFRQLTETNGNLRALCEECTTVMHKRLAVAKLAALAEFVEVSITQGERHLVDSKSPCLNGDSERSSKVDAKAQSEE